MGQQKYTQAQQVIDTLRKTGGYATLGDLYHLVDTKSWATKTPNESIRRIVQQSNEIFKIQPDLWALEECREEVVMTSFYIFSCWIVLDLAGKIILFGTGMFFFGFTKNILKGLGRCDN